MAANAEPTAASGMPAPSQGAQSAPPRDERLSHAQVLAIALPIMLSNATVPLIGFADQVVIGQLGQTHLLGATALASNLFNFLYFLFAFLRMGTTGLTAQATGARDPSEIAASLYRPLLAAGVFGVAIVVLQAPIFDIAMWGFRPSERVASVARSYYDIRIWAAPAGLANFALIGWFIGLGRADTTFYLQLFLNGLNIAFAVLFVSVFGWGVPGAGLAALLAEYIAVAVGIWVALAELRRRKAATSWTALGAIARLEKLFGVSRDILIRTACLQTAFAFFVSQGAQASDLTLATNAVLFSMTMIAIYMIDGFAYAAETFVGQAIGAQRRQIFRDAIRMSTQWAAGVSVVLAVVLYVGGGLIVDFMTTAPDVRASARVFLAWAALVPITSVWCFQLDGIFIGATDTATMRNMMIGAVIVYFAAWAIFAPSLGNHGLWLALHIFFLARAIGLAAALPALERRSFPDNNPAA